MTFVVTSREGERVVRSDTREDAERWLRTLRGEILEVEERAT